MAGCSLLIERMRQSGGVLLCYCVWVPQLYGHPGVWPVTGASISSSMLRDVLLRSAGGPQHNRDHRALSARPDGQPGV